jgi:hypothetical protein
MIALRAVLTSVFLLGLALSSFALPKPQPFPGWPDSGLAQAPTGSITNRIVGFTNAVWDVSLFQGTQVQGLQNLTVFSFKRTNGTQVAFDSTYVQNGRGQLAGKGTNEVLVNLYEWTGSQWADMLDLPAFTGTYVAHGSVVGIRGRTMVNFNGRVSGQTQTMADTNVLNLTGFGTNFTTMTFATNTTPGPIIDATEANGTYYWSSTEGAYTNAVNGYGVFYDAANQITWLTNSAYHDAPDTNFVGGAVVSGVFVQGNRFAVKTWYEGSNGGNDPYPGAVSSQPLAGPARKLTATRFVYFVIDARTRTFQGSDARIISLAGTPTYAAGGALQAPFNIPFQMGDGGWTLVLNFDPPSATTVNRLRGNASVTLNSGAVFPFSLSGAYSPTRTQSQLFLTGVTNSMTGTVDARGSTLSVTLGSDGHIVRMQGRIAGQAISQR